MSMCRYSRIKERYNEIAQELNLPKCRGLTKARLGQISARVRETSWDEAFEALEKLKDSTFCQGNNNRGWRANFDFVFQASSYMKLLEGYYDDAPLPKQLTNLEKAMMDAYEDTSDEPSVEADRVIPFQRKHG